MEQSNVNDVSNTAHQIMPLDAISDTIIVVQRFMDRFTYQSEEKGNVKYYDTNEQKALILDDSLFDVVSIDTPYIQVVKSSTNRDYGYRVTFALIRDDIQAFYVEDVLMLTEVLNNLYPSIAILHVQTDSKGE
jgi:hypothetical protein